MKKYTLLLIAIVLSGRSGFAQFTGGSGNGIYSSGISGKHLTNWFQTNGNWSTAGNWADGVLPLATEEANIMAEATLDGSYTYPVVNITASGVLTIPDGSDLTVSGTLDNNNGNAGVILEDGSSLIHPDTGVPGTMMRSLSNADWTNGMDGWHLLSSPVEDQPVNTGGFTTDPYDFYAWSETGNEWLNQKIAGNNITGFIPGEGYLVSYDDGGTKTFSGNLNVSNISLNNLSRTGTSYYIGYHLLGNPFTSALKWNDGNWALNNVSGVASVWNETAQNYLSLANPDDIIPANQGFFVQVTDASNSLTIPEVARTHDAAAFYKEVPADFLKFSVKCNSNKTFDETILRFNPGATTDYDPAFDGHKITGSETAPQLYTVIQPGENAAVNTYAEAGVPGSVEMGFRPGIPASYTLSVPDDTFLRQIVLEDRQTGYTGLVKSGLEYSFNATPGDADDRFILYFSPLSVSNPAEASGIQVYTRDRLLVLQSGSGTGTYQFYDLTGKMLGQGLVAQGLTTVSLHTYAPGVYLVVVHSDTDSVKQKVFIK